MPSYSLTKAAAILEIHRNTLAAWMDRGCPAADGVDRASGDEWQISIPAVIDWRIKVAVDDAVNGLLSPDGKISKDEADRRRAVAQARLSEIEVDERLRSVILVDDVRSIAADFCQALRSGFSNAGAKVAGRTAGMSDPNEIRDFCEAEFNRCFAVAEALLNDKWDGGEASNQDDAAAVDDTDEETLD